MMTITSPSLPLIGTIAALYRSWLAAFIEAVTCAWLALLAGPAGVDPEVGFRR